ncbi:putative signal-transducing kinase with PAS/PAC domain [Desulforapulum autotrophicum HRM2]|uniref:histidine kinase n=1 Tax=Desulforapulum autotrophicum (strain ATCC 43914 / DSM 3382 / VKM B-1955 / HRM2) TaxID=177437 RepID=C0QIA3_DESAH|nr:PAS domain-containing hybrid sensor histidine kinase/response regulator [Desulforapulum autotrophicum]ACN15839.1 putative signal-transducing kinase with PAS/PAC domain [Desulforapulum autotrophicum HRM2]
MIKNYKVIFTVVLIVLTAIFLSFVVYYQKSTQHKADLALDGHAVIIADALWRYEKSTPIEYLKLAAKALHYKKVSVFDDSSNAFIEIKNTDKETAEDFLTNAGLLPVYHLEKNIFYNKKHIGKITIDWQNRAVFTYFYIFLCLVLVLMAVWLFLNLTVAKMTLEDRVIERTADLKASENRLRLSEERLEMALAGANDGIWDWNLETGSVHYDTRYYVMLGYKPHEFQSSFEAFEKRVHSDDIVGVKNAIENYLSGKIDIFHQEFRMLNKNGDYQWIRSKGKIAVRDKQNKPVRFIGTHSDINEHKILEKARDDAYGIINSSPLVAFIWKNEQGWPVEFVTENIENVFGYHPDELLSHTIRYDQIVFPDDLKRVGHEIGKPNFEKKSNNFIHRPYRIITKSGNIRWVEDRTYIKRNDTGEITHYHGILMDITNRIDAEEAQIKSNRILKLVLNSIPVRVFWKDTQSIYLGGNQAFAEDAGLRSPDDLVGKTDHDLAFSAQAGVFQRDEKEVIRSGKSKLFYEEPQDRPDGKTNWLLTSKVPMRDAQQKIIGILGTYQDITDRKQAEKEKIAAQKIAGDNEKLALVGQIAGKMAHDFNNILGIIMGNTELSLLYCKEPKTKKTLELIYEQTIRGKNLTKNLVAFAKDQELKQEFFRISEKINLVINLMRKDLEGIELIKQESPGVPELLADPGMIEHALVNLIQNSIHALSMVEHPRITVRTYSRGNQICFEIEDNGCGISKENLENIYEPSFTLKGSRDVAGSYKTGIKGTGYGMSNVKKYIEQHKGTISIESEYGSGTKFTISLPVIKKELTSDERIKTQTGTAYFEKYILLVEDETAIADVQYRILTQAPCNHKVDIANNGQVAMDLFDRNEYDLISLDYILPGDINGMDMYHHIRASDKTIPILFISGNIEFLESIKYLMKKDPYVDHLSKPCKNIHYLNSINKLFSRPKLI